MCEVRVIRLVIIIIFIYEQSLATKIRLRGLSYPNLLNVTITIVSSNQTWCLFSKRKKERKKKT